MPTRGSTKLAQGRKKVRIPVYAVGNAEEKNTFGIQYAHEKRKSCPVLLKEVQPIAQQGYIMGLVSLERQAVTDEKKGWW